jgi:hypothetical protein
LKKTCRKTTTETGRQHQEELLFAAEYKRIVEASRTGNTWRRNTDQVRARCRLSRTEEEEESIIYKKYL